MTDINPLYWLLDPANAWLIVCLVLAGVILGLLWDTGLEILALLELLKKRGKGQR